MTVENGAPDTFPKLLLEHARVRGDSPSIREKDLGIWQSWTWGEVRDEIEWLACGLAQAGLKRGAHVAVIGANRPRLYWTLTAAQALGAIPVPFYEDAVAQEMVYVFQNAEIEFAVVEDQEQADKLFEIMPQCPRLKRIWYDEARGLRHYAQEELASYDALRESGRAFARGNPGFFEREIARGRGSDTAIMMYTSGTTGHAKGVVLSHDNLVLSSRAYAELEGLSDREEVVAYLPMAWIGQNLFSYAQWMVVGFRINCPESGETTITDMREIGPTYYFAPPRVLEALLTQVTIRMEDASWVKRRMFHYCMALARRVGAKILDGQRVSPEDRALYALGGLLVYGPLKNSLGMSRVRVAYTAGEAIGPDLFVFYRSLGINLKQLYGSTETSVMVCVQPDGEVKPDTVGPPMKGVEIRVLDSGEIVLRCPGLFRAYYKNDDATREAKDAEGWFHTGDAGYFDSGGHLKIIDRAKDVGKLSDGTLFAPKYLENKLKFFPHIKEAVAFGHAHPEATAMINIDVQAVGDWAERRGIPYSGYTDLAAKPQVVELIADCVARVNADLARDPKLAGSQVHRFVILHKELDADDGELTRTRKVRRGFIGEKYATIVDALYSGTDTCVVEAQVRFEDGRTGNIRAQLKVNAAKTFARSGEGGGVNLRELEPGKVERRIGDVILQVEGISLAFGGVKALSDVSFDVREHEIRAIIGPNGAGKSSMLNVVNGVYRPQRGRITFAGETRDHMEPHLSAARGIARTFQSLALFKGMSVLDNILAGRNLKMRSNVFLQALRVGPALREEIEHRKHVEGIIDFLEIQHVRKTPVGRLPYGLQKRVDLGRALAAEPRVLLLDEPMAGMNVEEKQDMSRFILDVNDEFGTTIVLIEHDMGVVMDLSDRVVVLDYGRKIADGTPDEVRASQAVIDAYLGVKH